MYTYLTGSASWYLLTLVNEVFGVRGQFGDLVIDPKLVAEQFDQEGKAQLRTRFADRIMDVIYFNPAHLDFCDYHINAVVLDGRLFGFDRLPIIIPRSRISSLDPGRTHRVEIELGQ
jgi:cellobiose phosphorylase